MIGRKLREKLRAFGRALIGRGFTFWAFTAALCVWLGYLVLLTSFFASSLYEVPILNQRFFGRMLCLAVALGEAGRITRGEYSGKDAVAIALAFLMCRGFYLHQDWAMLYSTIAIFGARGLPLRRLLWPAVITVFSVTLFVIVCSQVGVVPDVILDHGNGRLRHCLGFLYTLYPAQYLLNITLVLCFLLDRKMRPPHALLLLAATGGMFLLTQSRLIAFVSACVVLAFLVRKLPAKNMLRTGKIYAVLSWAFPATVVITAIASITYVICTNGAPEVASVFNTLTEGRVGLQVRGLATFGARPFGQIVQWVGSGLDVNGVSHANEGYNFVDNLYLHSLIQHGIIYTVALITLATARARRAWRGGETALVLVLAAVAFQAMFDDLSLGLNFCAMWLSLASLYQNAKGRKYNASPQRKET